MVDGLSCSLKSDGCWPLGFFWFGVCPVLVLHVYSAISASDNSHVALGVTFRDGCVVSKWRNKGWGSGCLMPGFQHWSLVSALSKWKRCEVLSFTCHPKLSLVGEHRYGILWLLGRFSAGSVRDLGSYSGLSAKRAWHSSCWRKPCVT